MLNNSYTLFPSPPPRRLLSGMDDSLEAKDWISFLVTFRRRRRRRRRHSTKSDVGEKEWATPFHQITDCCYVIA
jgi:hypothetical protein